MLSTTAASAIPRAQKVDMRQFIRSLVSCLAIFCVSLSTISCCTTINILHPILSGPQQAQQITNKTVAMIADFTPHQPSYCTGVWVAHDTILTAHHCVQAYVEMQHRVAIIHYLVSQGLSMQLAIPLSGANLADIPDLEEFALLKTLLQQALALYPAVSITQATYSYAVEAEVGNVGEKPYLLHSAFLIADAQNLDISLLRVVGPIPPHDVAQLADHNPIVGESTYTVGQSMGMWFSFKKFTVSAYRINMVKAGMKIEGPFMQVDGAMLPGDSGGGMFNEQGQLVGMNDFVQEDTNMGFCAGLDNLRKVLIGSHIIGAKLDINAHDPDLGNAPLNLQ